MTDIEIRVPSAVDVVVPVLGSTVETILIEVVEGDVDGGFASCNYGGTGLIEGGTADEVFTGPTIDGGDAGPPVTGFRRLTEAGGLWLREDTGLWLLET